MRKGSQQNRLVRLRTFSASQLASACSPPAASSASAAVMTPRAGSTNCRACGWASDSSRAMARAQSLRWWLLERQSICKKQACRRKGSRTTHEAAYQGKPWHGERTRFVQISTKYGRGSPPPWKVRGSGGPGGHIRMARGRTGTDGAALAKRPKKAAGVCSKMRATRQQMRATTRSGSMPGVKADASSFRSEASRAIDAAAPLSQIALGKKFRQHEHVDNFVII